MSVKNRKDEKQGKTLTKSGHSFYSSIMPNIGSFEEEKIGKNWLFKKNICILAVVEQYINLKLRCFVHENL